MANEYFVKILKKDFVTHNVKRFIVEKPQGYKFTPGQATDVSINNKLKEEKRPFTFTSTPNDLVLEFTIKKYLNGITEKIHELKPGEELILGEVFGYFDYKGEGVFIAGGTGITPFISIFRNIRNEISNNKLIFSNKEHKDILYEGELKDIFKDNVKFLLTEEKMKGYINKKINKNFLKKEIENFNQYFYVCGPPGFVSDIKKDLIKLGTKEEKIITDK